MCSHAKDIDLVSVGLVHFGKLCSQVVLGDVGSVWVEDVTIGNMLVSLVHDVLDFVRAYTTICFRDSSLFVMNFRVRIVTGWSALDGVAMFAVWLGEVDSSLST